MAVPGSSLGHSQGMSRPSTWVAQQKPLPDSGYSERNILE